MGKFIEHLRKTGGPLAFLANVLTFLTLQWGVAVSVVIGIAAGLWGWLADIVNNPSVQTGGTAFLAVLWTYIGISYVVRSKRPIITKPEQDFAYGLTFVGVHVNFDPANEQGALQFGLMFQNYGVGPITYMVDTMDIVLANRTLPRKNLNTPPVFLARGATRTTRQIPFPKADIKELIGKPLTGTLHFSAVYGHPDKSPVRRLQMTLDVNLILQEIASDLGVVGRVGFADSISDESDRPI